LCSDNSDYFTSWAYAGFSIIDSESNNLLEKAKIDTFFLAELDQVRVEIELRKMRYFLAIAEEHSFTRAAKRCHVAQASLSRQITIFSRQIDPGSANVEAMLLKAGIGGSSIVPAANLIELLDHVPVHRSIGLIRSSAGRLRRDDVVYEPLADSVQLETAIAWRVENRSAQLLSFRDALIAFGQRSTKAFCGDET
jgi:hypothetical protein